jgi:universal stress protein A
MAYNNILVAVDLTDEATEVLAAAKAVAEQQPGAPKLSAVTVVQPLRNTYAGLDMAGVLASAPFEEQMRERAIESVRTLAEEFGIAVSDTHVASGRPATEIRAAAEQLKADLIVIGTHGRHGIGLLLGSTANGVLHGVSCDVLVVKIHPEE